MSFAAALALLIGVFVAAPAVAHLLRRRHAEARDFPAAALLAATPPTARRRSYLEDRALFGIRVAQILAIALLGATPFVSCNKLSLDRKDGASVALAIVLDDSMSMTARAPDGQTRFEIARKAAADLLQGLEDGDAVHVVLAGAPPRVLPVPSGDRVAARQAIEAAVPSDRATDLEGAIDLGRDLVHDAEQQDRRVVLFSDLADGRFGSPALEGPPDVAFWAPVAEIVARGESDCAIASASRSGKSVTANVACSPGAVTDGRKVELLRGDAVLGSLDATGATPTLRFELPDDSAEPTWVRLGGTDALAADDAAAVTEGEVDFAIGIVADPAKNRLETGGPPPVEQAFDALGLGALRAPLSGIPDTLEEAKRFAGLLFDDPPGFTPEQRKVLGAYVEQGGEVFVTFGPVAASAPLGSDFSGLLEGVTHWVASPAKGADPDRCGFIGPSAASWVDVLNGERTTFDPRDRGTVLCPFTDGEPLLLRKTMGSGRVLAMALPLGVDHSDIALRPAFLGMVDQWVSELRMRGAGTLGDAGQVIELPTSDAVAVTFTGPRGNLREAVVAESRGDRRRFELARIGRYDVKAGAETTTRYVRVPPAELDLRPRELAPRAASGGQGGRKRNVDLSPYVAVLLLGLLVCELAVRTASARRATEPSATPPEATPPDASTSSAT